MLRISTFYLRRFEATEPDRRIMFLSRFCIIWLPSFTECFNFRFFGTPYDAEYPEMSIHHAMLEMNVRMLDVLRQNKFFIRYLRSEEASAAAGKELGARLIKRLATYGRYHGSKLWELHSALFMPSFPLKQT